MSEYNGKFWRINYSKALLAVANKTIWGLYSSTIDQINKNDRGHRAIEF